MQYSDDMVFNKGCKNRPIFPTDENISSAFEKDSDDVDADALTPQDSSTATTVQVPSKAPLTKKSRLDFMSKTQPLPLKSL
ncbi:hypothetical protein OESDEN_02174 [Oesophagostomum dentatum]|uniref:Uncharacterized protein n=1 Tax=Oesophagostomum dentatum TaxID=61180 RepID=A0A0B1TJV7_OESDE|nr:hypothetical protein OESDEN_02174 [Oesophagostomum dentatum]